MDQQDLQTGKFEGKGAEQEGHFANVDCRRICRTIEVDLCAIKALCREGKRDNMEKMT